MRRNKIIKNTTPKKNESDLTTKLILYKISFLRQRLMVMCK